MKYCLIMCCIIFISVNKSYGDFYRELAYRWAPVHYQDTDDTNPQADYITKFDFDGQYNALDNWENFGKPVYPLKGAAYYSVVGTKTHWFIIYAFFHPRDWSDIMWDQEHENDMEGILLIIKNDRSRYGVLQLMITVAHEDFHSYSADRTLTKGGKSMDSIAFQQYDGVYHPKTTQEAKGHGIKAWPHAGDFSGKQNQDGIIYYPKMSGEGEVPSSGNNISVKYELIDMNRLMVLQVFDWNKDYNQSVTFAKWGTFKGDNGGGCGLPFKICTENSCNSPWGWDDEDDGPKNYPGILALDPAGIAASYFKGISFSQEYTRNEYIAELRKQQSLPKGWPSQIDKNALLRKLPVDFRPDASADPNAPAQH